MIPQEILQRKSRERGRLTSDDWSESRHAGHISKVAYIFDVAGLRHKREKTPGRRRDRWERVLTALWTDTACTALFHTITPRCVEMVLEDREPRRRLKCADSRGRGSGEKCPSHRASSLHIKNAEQKNTSEWMGFSVLTFFSPSFYDNHWRSVQIREEETETKDGR